MKRFCPSIRVGAAMAILFGFLMLTSAGDLEAKPKKIQTSESMSYAPLETFPSKQAKGDIEIELKCLLDRDTPYGHPDVFSFTDEELEAIRADVRQKLGRPADYEPLKNAEKWFPKDKDGRHWVNVFGSPDGKNNVFAFKVKVRNNTGHIIKMNDVRVYMAVPGQEEPIAPANDLVMYGRWILEQEEAYENSRKKGILLDVPYPAGIATAVFLHKFPNWDTANAMKKEVLPGFSASGFLLFPVATARETGFDEVSVLFFEVPNKTDAAGTVVGRENFEFKYKKAMEPTWWDDSQKRWVYGDPPIASEQ